MNMYIGNLSYNVKELNLRQVMEEYGIVDSVKLIIKHNTEAQQTINKLNGAEYIGRQMVVKEALPRN